MGESQKDKMENSEEFSLADTWQKILEWSRYFRSYLAIIFFLGFIGGVIGYFYAKIQPPTYTAKIIFVVEDGKSGSSSFGGLASLAGQLGSSIGGNSGSGLLSGDNLMLYFKSKSLTRSVLLSRYDSATVKCFADVYADIYGLDKDWSKNLGKISFTEYSVKGGNVRLYDSLLQVIGSKILDNQFKIGKFDKKGSFIEVTSTMLDEKLAKTYCERVVKLAIDKYIEIKTKQQLGSVNKMQSRVDSLTSLLNLRTSSAANLQMQSNTMDINPLYKAGTSSQTESLVRDKSILSSILATAMSNLELAKFTLSQETPVIQIIDQSDYPLQLNKKSKRNYAFLFCFITSLLLIIFVSIKKIYKDHIE